PSKKIGKHSKAYSQNRKFRQRTLDPKNRNFFTTAGVGLMEPYSKETLLRFYDSFPVIASTSLLHLHLTTGHATMASMIRSVTKIALMNTSLRSLRSLMR